MKESNKLYVLLFISLLLSISCKQNIDNNKNRKVFSDTTTKISHELDHKQKVALDSLKGNYILESCENSRFSLKIGDNNSFRILDKTKTISSGKLSFDKDNKLPLSCSFGKIGALFYGDSIIIQNYGNSMNEYEHFTQCDEKYLIFKKQE